MRVRKLKENTPKNSKSRVTEIQNRLSSKKKEKPLYKYVDRTVDHGLEGMAQVEGDLGGYVQKEVGDRSTPDNPRHPSIGTRRPAGGMGTDPYGRAHPHPCNVSLGESGQGTWSTLDRNGGVGLARRQNGIPVAMSGARRRKHQMSEWSVWVM